MSDQEPFLSRWSRRKVEARDPVEPVAEMPVPPAPQPVANTEPAKAEQPLAELPSIESLRGLQSEYREFMKPDVDPGMQRAALKKLFSDPHFNQMDGLDVYIDDYNKFEPMSAAVAASLGANKFLRVVDHLLSEQEAKKAKAEKEQEPAETGSVGDSPEIVSGTVGVETTDVAGKTADVDALIEAPEVGEPEARREQT